MILIIGGAYQGKLDFAKEAFGVTDGDVCCCDAGEIDFSKRCVYRIEEFTCRHPDPVGSFQAHRAEWCPWARKTGPGGRPPGGCASIWPGKPGRSAGFFADWSSD